MVSQDRRVTGVVGVSWVRADKAADGPARSPRRRGAFVGRELVDRPAPRPRIFVSSPGATGSTDNDPPPDVVSWFSKQVQLYIRPAEPTDASWRRTPDAEATPVPEGAAQRPRGRLVVRPPVRTKVVTAVLRRSGTIR